jgi:pimeloyl-ACP methyl ester carboxylesterase
VAQAQERIRQIIRIQSNFDVIMGFSQGASLAASLILDHQLAYPNAPPLFSAAIFMCAPLPFSRCLMQGIDSRRHFGLNVGNSLDGRPADVPSSLIPEDPYFLQTEIGPAPGGETCSLHEYCKLGTGISEESDGWRFQMFHHSVDHVRIQIPTAHIYGKFDVWRPHSVDLIALCDGKYAHIYEHDGGHEVPKGESEEICDIIESTLIRSTIAV